MITRDDALAWLRAEVLGLEPDDPRVLELVQLFEQHAPALVEAIDRAGEIAGERQVTADVAELETERDYQRARLARVRSKLERLEGGTEDGEAAGP